MTAKRIGEPLVSLSLKVTPEFKRAIDTLALNSGRSQARQVVYLCERCWQFDDTMAALRMTLDDVKHSRAKAARARRLEPEGV
jgi:hypothetical protein